MWMSFIEFGQGGQNGVGQWYSLCQTDVQEAEWPVLQESLKAGTDLWLGVLSSQEELGKYDAGIEMHMHGLSYRHRNRNEYIGRTQQWQILGKR